MMALGNRLKESRIRAGFTQEEVAAKLNVGKQTVHKYEAGIIGNVPSDNVETMAALYNVTPSYLMGWADKVDPPAEKVPEEFFLAARKMGEIPEEQRRQIFTILDSTIDSFLAVKKAEKEKK